MQHDPVNFLELIIRISVAAGREIMEVYSTDFDVEMKDDNSPLTVADKNANKVISQGLSSTSIPVLSEEGKQIPYSERRSWRRFWMVDPLDGTKEFVKKNGEFTVNIALIEDGMPVLGVIFAPALDTLYFGSEETGSWMIKEAGKKICSLEFDDKFLKRLCALGSKLPLKSVNRGFTVVASRSHLNDDTKRFIEELKVRYGDVNFISSGSSLKICLVADGSADVYPRLAPTMEWDTAAGQAIAFHSGCKVNQYVSKSPVVYNKEDLLNPFFVVSRS
jgi:3'(2'), 5'-bisphosphate nucleotidase